MALESLVVVPDTHQRYHLIDNAGIIADMINSNGTCRKVIQVGDWFNDVDRTIAARLQKEIGESPQFQKLNKQLEFMLQNLDAYIKKEYDGDIEKYSSDFYQGKLPEHIGKMQQQAIHLEKQINSIMGQGIIEQTIYEQLKGFNEPIKKLKSKGIEVVTVSGNHDPKRDRLKKFLPDARVIGGPDNDPYENEGIIGHDVTFPPGSRLPKGYHAESGIEESDDDVVYGRVWEDLPDEMKKRIFDDLDECRKESRWYKRNKDKNPNFVVAHTGPRIGHYARAVPHEAHAGGGLTAFAEDKLKEGRNVTYLCGHLHDAAIYARRKRGGGKALIINPGTEHIAEVMHNNGEVEMILLYEAADPGKGAVKVFTPTDTTRAILEREGIVWMGEQDYRHAA